MNIGQFLESLEKDRAPVGVNQLLLALWYDAKGDWEKSHSIAQDITSNDGALIHAYLHRKEGDNWNADYWYRSADKKRPEITLEEEWNYLLNAFISK